jgi:hypothetical protein
MEVATALNVRSQERIRIKSSEKNFYYDPNHLRSKGIGKGS